MEPAPNHKAGFVALVGEPNTGKSTLLNKLVGEQLAIITPRAQTTRHRIKGILNGHGYQVVFSDTPGILDPAYKLHERMMDAVEESCSDADVIVFVTDASRGGKGNPVPESVLKHGAALVIAINKIDLSDQQKLEALVTSYATLYPTVPVIPVSATESFNLDVLLRTIVTRLPAGPPYFPGDELTDRSQRFFVSEIIREKILLNYREEIPYSTEVVIGAFKEGEHLVEIQATIFVLRESQKAILLGHHGKAIKKMATQARLQMEKFLEKKVFLDLTVKVSDNWRDDDRKLRSLGYDGK